MGYALEPQQEEKTFDVTAIVFTKDGYFEKRFFPNINEAQLIILKGVLSKVPDGLASAFFLGNPPDKAIQYIVNQFIEKELKDGK